jgi:hypothetical protein
MRFSWDPPPPATVRSLAVSVSTGFFDREQQDTGGSPLTLGWKDAASRLHRAAPPAAGEDARIDVHFTLRDRRRSEGGTVAETVVEDALLSVALDALEAAAADFLPGANAPAEQTQARYLAQLENRFSTPISGWPTPHFGIRTDQGNYSIRITGTHVISGVTVEIVRGQIDLGAGMADFEGANPAIEQKIREDLRNSAARLEAKMTGEIQALRNHVPTEQAVNNAKDAMHQSPWISGGIHVRRQLSGIVLTGTRHWSLGRLNLKAGLSGAFTPENFLTGTASGDASNLLRNLIRYDVQETYNLSVQAGSEVQRSSLDLAIPRTSGVVWVKSYGFRQNFLYARDARQRFGDNDPALAPRAFRQKGMTPAVYFEIARQPDDRFRWLISSHLEARYEWQAMTIQETAGGQISAPVFELRQGIGRDLDGFISSFRIQMEATAKRGTRALAGDYSFDQWILRARGQVFFGPQHKSEYFLRYERGRAGTGAGTPLFELPRLGGPASVRGIENGEFIGRALTYEQYGAGVRILTLVSYFHPVSEETENRKIGGLDLGSLYVTPFYDRGRAGDRPSAHGYGIAAEIRNLAAGKGSLANLRIGWARSPQSRLHAHGTMTVGVGFDY